MTFVRRDIWNLQTAAAPWDPITLAYAGAVREMQNRPSTDPTSWTYQAAIHGTYTANLAGSLWNKCQHSSWHFLPWHRMYVYWFERMVRSIVVGFGGPSDWALPYWNYGRGDDQARSLPPAFREQTLPDGSPNPLFEPNRGPGINAGGMLARGIVDPSPALADLNFSPPPSPGFGGGASPIMQFDSHRGDLESQPHNVVHDGVGGLMGDPLTAAADPIFWLHHANIDRLWVRWLAQAGRANPMDQSWLNSDFPFFDERGNSVSSRTRDALDTVSQLNYRYDDAVPAVFRKPIWWLIARRRFIRFPPPPPPEREELVAATDNSIKLRGGPVSVRIPLTGAARIAAGRIQGEALGEHLYLRLEGLDTEDDHNVVYEVYLNMPAELRPGEFRSDFFVGNLSFFGAKHHRDVKVREGSPPGLTQTFEISGLVQELHQRERWNPEVMTVSFDPTGVTMPGGEVLLLADQKDVPTALIGRVSLFHSQIRGR
jgi:hypothetical protein